MFWEECSLHSPPPYKPIDTVQGIIREVRVQKSVSKVGLACRAATFFEVMRAAAASKAWLLLVDEDFVKTVVPMTSDLM
jgi:hypothetical protein